jgi:hypothetical protein
VATALEYRLHPVTDVLAGTLMYPDGRMPELLEAFVRFVAAAPDEMCCGSTRTSSRKGPRTIKKRRRAALTLTGPRVAPCTQRLRAG